jgi:DNA polymerase
MTVVDYTAIEARVIAWLAQEDWKLEVFRTHGKIYEATGARMFNVPIEQVVKGSPMRDKAKAAELALGFGGGIDALHAFDNDADVNQVYAWRKANPKIVGLWKAFGDAVACGDEVKVAGCTFRWLDSRTLEIVLPSGRSLFYRGCKWINGSLHYLNDTQNLTKTWGGTLVQNVVQALARDVLAEAMIALDYYGYHILLTVHDEVVVAGHHLKDIEEVMVVVPKWAKGLPLACEGAEFNYYQK